MYKCDKCGCEHTSRTTCPKCGAPVILVNEDYLRRRREWEEQQKNGGAAQSRSIAERTVAAVLGQTDVARQQEGRRSGGPSEEAGEDAKKGGGKSTKPQGGQGVRNRFLGIKKGIVSLFEKVRDGIKGRTAEARKTAARKKRHKSNGPALEMDIEDEMAYYEKMLLDHVVFKSRMKKRILIGAGIAAAAAAVIVAVCIAVNKDRSDLVYFNGHELVSAAQGVLADLDSRENGYEVRAYSGKLNAMLLEKTDGNTGLLGWYEGQEYALVFDGSLTNQYLFSENGRYAAYVSCMEAGGARTAQNEEEKAGQEKRTAAKSGVRDSAYTGTYAAGGDSYTGSYAVEGTYYLNLVDLKEQNTTVYESGNMLDLEALTEDGRVVYTVLNTVEYSIVVSRDLYVADKNGAYPVADSVSETAYNAEKDAVLFLSEDSLYLCSIGKENLNGENGIIFKKQHILVAENVLSIAENRAGGEILYLTEEGLWNYGKENCFLASGADSACSFYLLKNGSLYYRRLNTLYAVKDGISEIVADNVKDILCDEQGARLMCLTGSGELYGLNGKTAVAASGIDSIGLLYGAKGCAAVCDGQLVCVEKSRKGYKTSRVADYSGGGSMAAVYSSRGFLYYTDADGILWKVSKKDGSRTALGYVQIAAYRE